MMKKLILLCGLWALCQAQSETGQPDLEAQGPMPEAVPQEADLDAQASFYKSISFGIGGSPAYYGGYGGYGGYPRYYKNYYAQPSYYHQPSYAYPQKHFYYQHY